MATAKLLVLLLISRLILAVLGGARSLTFTPNNLLHHTTTFDGHLTTDPSAISIASRDFGMMTQSQPSAVLHPASAVDISRLIKAATQNSPALIFSVSARGHGHSINGQAQTPNGVVIEMSRRHSISETASLEPRVSVEGRFVDVWGGELWINVLNATLEFGLAPKSWTDYLYLSVGGTLSNGGISGQAFNHGPQISNVHEMDVVSGKGEVFTCSKEENRELFHSVLGGLGQFGIITRARIALEQAPKRVKWIRVLYTDFSAFTQDQEYLISLHGNPSSQRFDYVEGFVIVDEGLINNWRSSFFSPKNPIKISTISTGAANGSSVLYCLEITKNYDESNADSIDQEVEDLLTELQYIPATEFTTDLPYIDFLDRVHKAELKLRAKGLWDVPHPWLNLFVPSSQIGEFDKGVFKGILGNKTSGPILIYPMNKNKWEQGTSVVIPDEDVFYLVAFLRSALEDEHDESHTLENLMNQNRQILKFCKDSNINVKQYLPHYTSSEDWIAHFESQRWDQFSRRKLEFDPKHILATGQRIFSAVTGCEDKTFIS